MIISCYSFSTDDINEEKSEEVHYNKPTFEKHWSVDDIYSPSKSKYVRILKVELDSNNLIYVLDSYGIVTIINKDLGNEESGVIFTLKKWNIGNY